MAPKKNKIQYGEEKWDSNGEHAALLSHLFKTGAIPTSWSAGKICEMYPQFTIYPQVNFRSTVYRYKNKISNNDISIKNINDDRAVSPLECFDVGNKTVDVGITSGITNRCTMAIPEKRTVSFNEERLKNEFEEQESEYDEDSEGVLTKYLPNFNEDGIEMKKDGTPIHFKTTTSEFSLGFEVIEWKVPRMWSNMRTPTPWMHHVTVNIYLPKLLDVTDCRAVVSNCQYKLNVYLKLPDILDLPRVDERNAKVYVDNAGSALYPPMHVRSVAHKSALRNLPRNEEGRVELSQSIWLPCKVAQDPISLEGRPAIRIKALENGKIYVLVVELIAKECASLACKSGHATSEEFTTSGSRCGSRGGRSKYTLPPSVFSINYDTGVPNIPPKHLPKHVRTHVPIPPEEYFPGTFSTGICNQNYVTPSGPAVFNQVSNLHTHATNQHDSYGYGHGFQVPPTNVGSVRSRSENKQYICSSTHSTSSNRYNQNVINGLLDLRNSEILPNPPTHEHDNKSIFSSRITQQINNTSRNVESNKRQKTIEQQHEEVDECEFDDDTIESSDEDTDEDTYDIDELD